MENEWRGLLVPEGMTSNKPRDVNAISQPDGFIPKGFRGSDEKYCWYRQCA